MVSALLAKRRKANLMAPDEARATPTKNDRERLEQRVLDAVGNIGPAGVQGQIEGLVRRVAAEVIKG